MTTTSTSIDSAAALSRALDTPLLDFTSPAWPAPRAARRALLAINPAAPADQHCEALRERLATLTGLGAESIVIGNGATEIVHLMARAVGPGSLAVLFAPADSEVERAAQLAGILTVRLGVDAALQWDLDSACQRIQQLRPAIVYLANPSALTGAYVGRGAVESLLASITDGALLLDDSLAGLAELPWDATPLLLKDGCDNLVLLRSLGGVHGLGGLRIGYALTDAVRAQALREQQPRRAVNAAAQAAALAALDDLQGRSAQATRVRRSRAFMLRALQRAGWKARPSAADSVLIEAADEAEAATLRARFAAAGVRVQDAAAIGLPSHLRLAVQPLPLCRELALRLPRAGA